MNSVYLADRGLQLGPNDVHVWVADLNRLHSQLARLESYLGADECARADRYYFRRDRDRFVSSRGILRELLGLYSAQRPADLHFTYGPHGKPTAIRPGFNIPNFNCSRSADIALFAFTLNRDVGIDVEHIEEDEDFLNIAVQYYTHSELELLKGLEPSARAAEFFRCWTRREALLKATGEGLSRLSAELDVSSSLIHGSDGLSCWTISTLDLVPGYASSLASSGTGQIQTVLNCAAIPVSSSESSNPFSFDPR